MSHKRSNFSRRDMLKLFGVGGASALVGGKAMGQVCLEAPPFQIHQVEATTCGQPEVFPASPFVMEPYRDPLPVPRTLRPGWQRPDGTRISADAPEAWSVRVKNGAVQSAISRPGPEAGAQDAIGERPNIHPGLPNAGTHQLYPGVAPRHVAFNAREQAAFDALAPTPILYHVRLQLGVHSFTSSPVKPINSAGAEVTLPPGVSAPRAPGDNRYFLPPTTIYGFNGAFPGAMINQEYGKPVIIRFENDLDINPNCYDRQNFGAPDWAFLTHQHNGHNAPESDGNPHHMTVNEGGYQPGEWFDALYLGYPAGGDNAEKQSFLWFHDHRMHHTGPNVYKGMVGLMPTYDPGVDDGDERHGLRLPGVRINNPDGTFDVEYDIPMAFYDCALDDGITIGSDMHTPTPADLAAHPLPGWDQRNMCGLTHPEWWGRLFLRHYPNHGFVGDVFTVNIKAYPVLEVRRRKYRLRFLGASLARCYDLSLRKGTPLPFPGQQGQWNFGRLSRARGGFGVPGAATQVRDSGQQVFKMMQIAVDGGLLPVPIERNSIEIWPGKRREVVIDFTRYMDGTPTTPGDVVYLCNTMEMTDGRKPIIPGAELPVTANYCVPMMKIVIGEAAPDNSLMPVAGVTPLRPLPAMPTGLFGLAPDRSFKLERGNAPSPETEWLINGLEFNPLDPLARPTQGSAETWEVNTGGGWTHPMHFHHEEFRVVSRNGVPAGSPGDPRHIDDIGKEDLVALDPGDSVVTWRQFRTYLGNYVAHCHNLAHEDHNMMYGFTVEP